MFPLPTARLLNGEHVLGSPVPLLVEAAEAHPPACYLRNNTPEVAAGGAAALVLRLCDRYGNELASPPPKFTFELRVERLVELRRQGGHGVLVSVPVGRLVLLC